MYGGGGLGLDGGTRSRVCNVDYNIGRLPTYPHPTSNLQQTKNETTNVVINITVVELLMMGIVVPETC